MLGKMIKHEFKATSRLFVPVFLGVAVFTPLLALLIRISSSIGEGSALGKILTGFSGIGFVLMLAGLCISACLFIVIRFYKTVATSEAYLTFCLPARSSHILLSKLIVGVIWQMLAVALLIGALCLTWMIQGGTIPKELDTIVSSIHPLIMAEYGSMFMFFVNIGTIILVSVTSGTLSFFLAICLGQMFNEHRVVASIGMYAAIYTVGQIVSLILFIPVIANGPTSIVVGNASMINVEADSIPKVSFLLAVTGVQLLLAIGYYIGCSVIMKKKTNVR